MSKTSNFLSQLSSQTAELAPPPKTPEEINESIMRIIDSWRKNKTIAFQSFLNRNDGDKQDPAYLGRMFAKAGIPYKDAWEYAKDALHGFYDNEYNIRDEFDNEYNRTPSDSLWRIIHFSNVK